MQGFKGKPKGQGALSAEEFLPSYWQKVFTRLASIECHARLNHFLRYVRTVDKEKQRAQTQLQDAIEESYV
ncbi:MAG: hypothetical protein RR505_05045 [Raoultibacter sp.]